MFRAGYQATSYNDFVTVTSYFFCDL